MTDVGAAGVVKKKIQFSYGEYYGEEKDEKPHGKGELKYKSGDVYDGEWKDGERHGQGVYKYKWRNEDVYDVYDGEWENNEEHGHGVMKYANDDVYDGEWKNGMMCKGIMTYANGDVYDGEWENGKRHGNGILTVKKDGKKYDVVYEYEYPISHELRSATAVMDDDAVDAGGGGTASEDNADAGDDDADADGADGDKSDVDAEARGVEELACRGLGAAAVSSSSVLPERKRRDDTQQHQKRKRRKKRKTGFVPLSDADIRENYGKGAVINGSMRTCLPDAVKIALFLYNESEITWQMARTAMPCSVSDPDVEMANAFLKSYELAFVPCAEYSSNPAKLFQQTDGIFLMELRCMTLRPPSSLTIPRQRSRAKSRSTRRTAKTKRPASSCAACLG